MISRVADHCFWMSRYLERAENTARVLEVNQTLLLDFPVPLEQQWQPLLIISGIHDMPKDADGETVQHHLTWEASNPASITSSIEAARENARNIREVISAEVWERLNYYYLWIQSSRAQSLYHDDRNAFYSQIKRINQLMLGISEGTMSHGEAWDFFQLGKYLERACQTARILDVKYHILLPTLDQIGTPVDNAHWVAILMSCSGYEPFHKQRPGADPGVAVSDFLIFDSIFPRSVRFCLGKCRAAAYAISGRPLGRAGNAAERALDELVNWLNLAKVNDFVDAGLHEALTSVIDRIHGIGDAIHRTYFDQRDSLTQLKRRPTEQHFTLLQRKPQHFPPLQKGRPQHFPPLRRAKPEHFPPLRRGGRGEEEARPGRRSHLFLSCQERPFMPIHVALNHKTIYRYERLVTLLPQVVRLRPAPHCRTPILSYSLRVEPHPHYLNWQQDPYSNYLARLVFPKPLRELAIEVDLVAEMTVINPFDFFIEENAEKFPFRYDAIIARELIPYLETEPAGPLLQALVSGLRHRDVRTVDYVVELNHRLHEKIRYVIRLEPGVQTCEQTLQLGSGSCRDTGWLLVQLLRQLGLAARFVSGYLIQLKADVPALDGPSGTEVDFTDLHAWAEVYLPGAGWVGLDPTSGLLAGEGHLPLACTADTVSAAPVTGSYSWNQDSSRDERDICETKFEHHMSVQRVHEDPRVTKPYTEEEWQAINQLGRTIDERLRAGDVRLTMGGEPTFVSIDDMDGEEWNTAALGDMKRLLAGDLLKRLKNRFASGALLHYGQGKLYPGEPFPRWSLGCYWRADGVPLWEHPELIADETRDYGHTAADAQRFITTLAERLGVDPQCAQPAYEDVFYYLWREQQLPVNLDPRKNNLDDPVERHRLTQVFDRGLNQVVSYVLPLQAQQAQAQAGGDAGRIRWISDHWDLRRGNLFLLPGDSSVGFRLPLGSLPWASEEDSESFFELDPFAPRAPLPPRASKPARRQKISTVTNTPRRRGGPDAGELRDRWAVGQSISGVVRTALCAEPRDGRIHVFLPPQEMLESFLDLISALEATAAELDLPVILEGYRPPVDPRIEHFSITPDPGVIEVNIHPSQTWDELVMKTAVLYEEARLSRLGTEKFMLDGRHTGTGGGNHVVIGGPTPADSPVLRRPDLLRSLINYWHNHPSLSYLFSGLFVGPHSQAPRLDEARNDSLYEMEIAFRQIPDHGGAPPWLVDRVFRHLLVDVTGNTHRAEFCIDKLYNPDSASGRLGLVEMRAFEMPPHARMSLAQQLLIRGLIARFWENPVLERLIPWGTDLHDRFLLPHFVNLDFQDVILDMRRAGYAFQSDWFAPHFEFRFPAIGTVAVGGIVLELRQAIEPWHILGEETTSSGTARYVDSSVERLQVKVQGMTEGRQVVTCNGRRVPLHSTGTCGEYVAGVRYRAWQPPSCLHPTIPINSPVVFDIWDPWLKRSVGGCTYHVVHPGGRSYDTFPVNANEAEGRRHSRFFPYGHTPGTMEVPPLERHPAAPLTLDLRRPP